MRCKSKTISSDDTAKQAIYMNPYLAALWFAVALNIFSVCFNLYWAHYHYKKYNECAATMHELENVHAMLTEHLPVER